MPTEILKREYVWKDEGHKDELLLKIDDGVSPGVVDLKLIGLYIFAESRTGGSHKVYDSLGHKLSVYRTAMQAKAHKGHVYSVHPRGRVQSLRSGGIIARWVEKGKIQE